MRPDPPRGDRVQVDRPRGTDDRARPARLALRALLLVGWAHFASLPAAEEIDCSAAHHLVADAHTKPAEDALLAQCGLKRGRLNAQAGGKLGQLARIGRLGQEQFEHRPARLFDSLRLGANHQRFVDRVAARGHQLAPAGRFNLDQAHPAGAVRRQPAIVAERRDRHAQAARGT